MSSAALDARAARRVGEVIAGQYRIEEVLGGGGMGCVYRAVQLSVNRPVALKVAHDQHAKNAELMRRFRREAQAMARLQHPHSLRLYDFGVTEHGELFLVMELLSGENLGRRLRREGALPVDDALTIADQILQSLAEAHRLGIVHRDLKPDNVFLSDVNGDEIFVRVIDFGIAGLQHWVQTTLLTKPGSVLGTPTYMSPEQCQARVVDHRSDLYSLGLLLFELLTGKPPFDGETLIAILVQHVSATPPRLAEVRPSLAEYEALQDVLDILLAKSPDERFQNAEAAREALSRARKLHASAAPQVSTPPVVGRTIAVQPSEDSRASAPQPLATPAPRVPRPQARASEPIATPAHLCQLMPAPVQPATPAPVTPPVPAPRPSLGETLRAPVRGTVLGIMLHQQSARSGLGRYLWPLIALLLLATGIALALAAASTFGSVVPTRSEQGAAALATRTSVALGKIS